MYEPRLDSTGLNANPRIRTGVTLDSRGQHLRASSAGAAPLALPSLIYTGDPDVARSLAAATRWTKLSEPGQLRMTDAAVVLLASARVDSTAEE